MIRAAAIVTLRRPGAMTAKGRAEVVAWLRRTATDFSKLGSEYTRTGSFRARYLYRG